MKFKYSLFLAVLLVFICCIGAASAADDVADVNLTVTDDVVVEQADAAEPTLEINTDENEILSATGTATVSTWSDLKTYSQKSDKDYTITVANGNYNVGSDKITFGNNAKIIGSGNTVITGGDSSVIPFNGNGKSITFSNIIFRNMNPDMVIQLTGDHSSKIENCVFENIKTSTSGQKSVVFNNGGYLKVTNTNFINCNTTYGVITNHKTPTTALMDVENCKFEYNNAVYEPGAINNCGIMNVTNSIFNYNHAGWWAGAIHTHANAKSVIKKSSFTGNTAGWNGGALYTYATLEVYDSNFTNNNCSTNAGGGAIGASNYFFAQTKYSVKVNNCRFEGNKNLASGGRGGAIAAMNGGTLNVKYSTFIHNTADIGQAIAGYNTNEYANISEGNANLVIMNNKFINHTDNDADTVYIEGDLYTFTGNTFTNSPQTHYTGSNTYNSINLPTLLKSTYSDILMASFDDILSYKDIELYVNSSRSNAGDGSSWNNAANSLDKFYYDEDIFEDWISLRYYLAYYGDCDDGDSIAVNLANGEYVITEVVGYTKYVGFGNNVVIKDVSIDRNQALTYKSDKTNITFVNLIFEGFSNLDGLDCSFINCTFRTNVDLYNKRENGDFSKVISVRDGDKVDEYGNPIYTTTTIIDAPIFKTCFDNCTFENIESNSVIDTHKYANLNIHNCKFNNCVVDSLITTKSNLTKDDGSHDGVTISNINVSGSTFKGVLKAQKDTNYSVEKVSGITPTADIIEDGNNVYLNATDVKAEEPINNETSGNTTNVTKVGTKIIASKVNAVYNTAKKLTVTLKDVNDNVLAGKNVVIKLNGKTYSNLKTNAKGQVVLSIPTNLAPKTYTATITFAGDDNYTEAPSATAKVVVAKATPKLTTKKLTTKVKVKTKKVTATLKDNKGKVLKNTKVTLKIKGKTYTAKTNKKGVATFKVTKLNKKGTFKGTVKFAGNKYFKAISKKVTVVVKK